MGKLSGKPVTTFYLKSFMVNGSIQKLGQTSFIVLVPAVRTFSSKKITVELEKNRICAKSLLKRPLS